MPKPFVVIGSATVDLFVSGLDRMPSLAGDEFTLDSLVFCEAPLALSPGGNGGNSAHVLGRLGAPTVLCSAVGRDWLGDLMETWLKEAGVETSGLVRSTAATSTTTIITDHARNRLSFHHAGATHAYTPPDVPPGLLDRAAVLLFCAYPLLKAWRAEGTREALFRAHRAGALTALDIGPAIDPPATFIEIEALLPAVDYLLCNEHELAACTGREGHRAGARQLLDAGVTHVVVKRGRSGAVVYTAGEAKALPTPGFPVAVRSTVGAGDAFNAGFLWALHQGQTMADALRFGHAVAACVVASVRGVLDSPTQAQAEALLRAT